MGSKNGTYVNGERLTRRRVVSPGDRIRLGESDLEVRPFEIGDLTAATIPREGLGSEEQEESAAALIGRAIGLFEERRWPEAEVIFRRVAETAPSAEAAEGRYGLGMVRMGRGDIEGAVSLFEQCLRLDPGHANALYRLGLIAARRGSGVQARAFFERALAANPLHAGARAALAESPVSVDHLQTTLDETRSPGTEAAYRKYGPYEFLLQDRSPLSQDTIRVLDSLRMSRRPHLSASLGRFLRRLSLVVGGVFLAESAPGLQNDFGPQVPLRAVGFAVASVGAVSVLRLLLSVMTTRVTIDKGRLQIEKGILARHLTNVELWRVEDIDFRQTWINRITGDGSLIFHLLARARGNGKHIEVSGLARGRRLRDMHQELLNLTWLLRITPAVKGVIY